MQPFLRGHVFLCFPAFVPQKRNSNEGIKNESNNYYLSFISVVSVVEGRSSYFMCRLKWGPYYVMQWQEQAYRKWCSHRKIKMHRPTPSSNKRRVHYPQFSDKYYSMQIEICLKDLLKANNPVNYWWILIYFWTTLEWIIKNAKKRKLKVIKSKKGSSEILPWK